jgi:hypothetical protein
MITATATTTAAAASLINLVTSCFPLPCFLLSLSLPFLPVPLLKGMQHLHHGFSLPLHLCFHPSYLHLNISLHESLLKLQLLLELLLHLHHHEHQHHG